MPNPVPKIHGSYRTLTDEQRRERARNAGKAAQSPETYAQKLVRDWPTLTASQKATIANALRPVLNEKAS
jgi:hypothetical protein